MKRTELRYPGLKWLESSESKTETRISEVETRNLFSWDTREGRVVMQLLGSRVVIVEGIPEGVDRRRCFGPCNSSDNQQNLKRRARIHAQNEPMNLPKLTAVIEKEDDWYVATCPELGVASQGRSLEEAEAMIQEAVELFLEEADEAEITRRLNRGVRVKQLELAHA